MSRFARVAVWLLFAAASTPFIWLGVWFVGSLLDPSAIAPKYVWPQCYDARADATSASSEAKGQTAVPFAQPANSASGASVQRSRNAPIYAQPVPAELRGVVWVNIPSHIYHYPGYHWFGTTQRGKYMREEEAIAEGNRASLNERRPLDFDPAPDSWRR